MAKLVPITTVAEWLDCVQNKMPLYHQCPDGVSRRVWGMNEQTGDVFITGWKGNVWMDCSNPQHMRLEFEKEE